jgi:BirA family transcriptional regulator, biotin operon repressor / biotin---[acetyl-CoA-carboxylase] ligase
MFTDAPVIHLHETDSTNNYAANLQKQSKQQEGTVILTDIQTHGRGQRGAIWESNPGKNLLCSIILYPDWLPAERTFALTKCLSLAVAACLEEFSGQQAMVKWPNDIIIKGKKISGLLVEAAWSGDICQQVIVGIGINVNQEHFSVQHAGSLAMLTGRHIPVTNLVPSLKAHVSTWYGWLKAGRYADIDLAYRQALYRLGVASRFIYNNRELMAMITGVDGSGRLQLYTEHGEGLSCDLREIAMVM